MIFDSNDELEAFLRETFPNGHPSFITLTLEELILHDRKNFDYAKDGDPLGNFKRVGAILSNYSLDPGKPEVVALIYALKQLDAAMWMLSKGYEGEVEDVDKRLEDVHVYVKLARILHGETKGKP